MAAFNPTVDLYLVNGSYTKAEPARAPAPISKDAGLYDKWLARATQFWSNHSEEESLKEFAPVDRKQNSSASFGGLQVEALMNDAQVFFHGDTVQKIDSLRAAFFCDRIKALSFVPYHLEQYQTYFVRKSLTPNTQGLIKPYANFTAELDPNNGIDPKGKGEFISSESDIDMSIRDLENVEPETKAFLKNILTSFLADPSTEIIGISYLNSAGEEKLGIWRKFPE